MTRYELLDRIGVGGMAEIFRGKAVAAGGFEKPVAIKRILPHLSQDQRFVELLIAEAKVLSLLKHRNIVQIFDVGLGDDGKYFLVMEYVDGKDVRAVQTGLEVRRRRMPFDLALHIGAEVCEALEHAHTAKAPDGKPMSLVHRDVSPSNVLLSRAGEVKLTDFGIAKRAEQEQTGTGGVRGKFAYISPEQARNEHLDPRSDVFSVGVLLWEMICNRRLFSGLGDLEALRAVRDAKVPRPQEIDRNLSPEIDALLMQALARDPKHRPTAGQFGAKLRSIRYSLEVTVGDPASELARVIETADEVQRQSQQMMAQHLPSSAGNSFSSFEGSEPGEHTVIRIRTADDFAMRDKDGSSVAKARMVIDRFEEEETRQAQLSGDQLKILRNRRDSAQIEPPRPPRLPGVSAPAPSRSRRPTDEPTVSRPPLRTDEVATYSSKLMGEEPSGPFDSDESTKLLAPRPGVGSPAGPAPGPVSGIRPQVERVALPRSTTQPPPMPTARSRNPSPPPFTSPGTVHERAGVPGLPQRPPTNARQLEDATVDEQPSMTPQPPSLPPPPMPPMGMMPPNMQSMPMQGMPMQMPQTMTTQEMPPGFPQQTPPPYQQPQQQPGYPMWGAQPQLPPQFPPQLPPRGASPTAPDNMYERPVYPQRPSVPVMGFERTNKRETSVKTWVLIVGAVVMAAVAFAITRLFLT